MERAANTTRMRDTAVLTAPLVFVLLWSTGPVATRSGVDDVAGLDPLPWRFAALAVIAALVLAEGVTPTAVTGLVVTSAGVAIVMHGHRLARRLLPSG